MNSMEMSYQVTGLQPGAIEPMDITTIKQFSRIDFDQSDNNAVLQLLATQARTTAESIMAKALIPEIIQVLYTLPQIPVNTLSGVALAFDQNFYQYTESLGANPFSPAPWFLDVPFPPLQSVSLFEYRTAIFQPWQTWPASNPDGSLNYSAETTQQPGRIWIQYPPPAYQYRLTCNVGYANGALPQNIKLLLAQAIAYWYDNRDQPLSAELQQAMLAKRSWVL